MFLLKNKQKNTQPTPPSETNTAKTSWCIVLEHRHEPRELGGYRFSRVKAVAQNEPDAVQYLKDLVAQDLPVGYDDLDTFLQAKSAQPGTNTLKNEPSMDMVYDGYDRGRDEKDVQMLDYAGWGYTYMTKDGIERSVWYKPFQTG